MNILKLLFFFIIFMIYVCRTPVNGINILVKLNLQDHYIFYNIREVEFSDVDTKNIMYHAHYVKYVGNSIYKYLILLNEKLNPKLLCFVKNINMTYMAPLKYQDKYKIIGAITNYGNTSLQITVAGVSHFNKTPTNLRKILKILKKKDLGFYMRDEQKYEIEENEKGIEKQFETEQEESIVQEAVDKMQREEMHETSEQVGLTEKVHESSSTTNGHDEEKALQKYLTDLYDVPFNGENCIIYFTGVFTFVNVNAHGQKESIPESVKQAYPPMDKKQFEKLVKILC